MSNITITVEGGVIQDIQGIPPGVTVIVRDYDLDGIEAPDPEYPNVVEDANGDYCWESKWVREDTNPLDTTR